MRCIPDFSFVLEVIFRKCPQYRSLQLLAEEKGHDRKNEVDQPNHHEAGGFRTHGFAGTVGTLNGTVMDAESKKSLPGANIIIEGTHLGGATGLDGKFLINNIPAGVYRVKISLMGYTGQIVENVAVIMDLRTNLDISLARAVIDLGEEVVIRAERPLIHSVTNYVVMNSTANLLLSMGASPVMAHAENEVEEMVSSLWALPVKR